MTIPKLSVVICTYNRDHLLPDCLQSVVKQNMAKELYEVIIVNNNSVDNTRQIVEEFAEKYLNFRLVDEPKQGLSHARNKGMNEAKAEWVAYMDDDARAHVDWLVTAFKIIEEKNPDIFGGPVYSLHLDERPKWYKDEYGIIGNMGETGWLDKGFLPGSNIIFRKGLLEEYGGFNTGLGMKGNDVGYHEETQLVHRALKEGKRVYYSNDLIINHLFFDYKYSLAFSIYKKYKAGFDGLKLWNVHFESGELLDLLKIIDQTMTEFDVALRKRDTSLYPYPENYIVERLAGNFVQIGMMVGYFLKKKE